MHRQSLGSPASKLQSHGIVFSDAGVRNDNNDNNFVSEDHRKDKCSASATDNEEHKPQKHNQQKSIHESSSSSSSKLVHLIPILTFFCFLILYLSSHDPSNTDLGQTQLSGFETLSTKKISVDDNVGGGSMEIQSVRKLEQPERRRFHRKFRQ